MSHVDISLRAKFRVDPKRRLSTKAEREMLVALTDALNTGYDGVRILWNRNDSGGVYVNPIKVGKGVRCG